MNTTAVLIASCILLPWLGAFVVWVIGDRQPRLQHILSVLFAVAAAAASLWLLPLASADPVLEIPVGGVFGDFTFRADGLGATLTAIACVIGGLAVLFSVDYMGGEAQLGRYYSLVLLFIGSMCGLVLTTNLLLVFFFWELTALTSYALISFHNDDPNAVRGGMKALLITQLGGIGLLVGALLAFAYTGSFEIGDLLAGAAGIPANVLAILAFGFLIAAAAKSAQFPFQTWLPDAMEAPTPVSALIHAATMVNAGIYLLARFQPAFTLVPSWDEAVMLTGLVTALMAAVMALTALDLKRVLAYSTVSQLGYMVFAVGAGGVLASMFHLLSHAIFKALLFLAAGAIIHSVGTRDLRQMGGLGARMPLVRNVFAIGALALAGLPILNGFWSKELILEAGLHHAPVWMTAGMILGAGLTALYTLRCYTLVFCGPPRASLHVHPAGAAMQAALLPLASATLISWLVIGPFSALLARTLPVHGLEPLSLAALARDVLLAPLTWLALAVIALGIAAWFLRHSAPLAALARILRPAAWAGEHHFGFEWINRGISSLTIQAAEDLRGTQTGIVGWNVFAVIAALIIVLALLAVGAAV